VYFAVHYVESFLEDVLDGGEIIEIAINNMSSGTQGAN